LHFHLAVYPVFAQGSPKLVCLTLGEALAAGVFEIGEVGGGSVPELLVRKATGRGRPRPSPRWPPDTVVETFASPVIG